MRIGTFNQGGNGDLHGKIYGLGLGTIPVAFEPQTSKEGKAYFRLIADPANEAYEIGAAFPKEKAGMLYHSVSIESPVLAVPVSAALFPDKDNEGSYNLIWNRPEPQDLKAEATVSVGGKHPTRRFMGANANARP